MGRTVEDIDKEIETQREKHQEAADALNREHQALEKLLDERDDKVVEGFDSALVDEARDFDLNPKNYGTEDALRAAIEHQKKFTEFAKEEG